MKVDGALIVTDLHSVPARTRELEALGYDGAISAEISSDPFLPLLLAAEHSQRLELMTSIAVAFARNPMLVAQMGHDLNAYSQGRFILGLGSQIQPHIQKRFSMPWSHPAPRMREFVLAMRAIWDTWNHGTPLEFRGEFYRHTLMTPMFDPGPNPHGPSPVWVAGLGPRMTACAAEVADGLLIHPFHTGAYVRECSTSAVAEGLTRGRRSRHEFTVHATPIVCTGTDDEEIDRATAAVRQLLGFYGSTPSYRVSLDHHGLGDLQDELNTLTKQGRWDEIADRITDDVVELFVVRGKPGEIARLVEERYAGEVDRVALSMPYEASDETVAALIDGFRQR
jgi:probable F420-dependent oxidoreductase